MNKEQLQNIKEKYMPEEYDYNLKREDIDLLINEAESHTEVAEQKSYYHETLKFYADPNIYKNRMLGQAVLLDSGRQAEKALDKFKNVNKDNAFETDPLIKSIKFKKLNDIELEKADELDNEIFNIICELNKLLELGVDISKCNHTEMIIQVREAMLEELCQQKERLS